MKRPFVREVRIGLFLAHLAIFSAILLCYRAGRSSISLPCHWEGGLSRMKKHLRKSSFTLIELLIVVAIIG
ncbi:MAG TPA: type II secretion system protein, partial [bacterium]|nr:type II secretion system protein [bacterium]